jgi:hypothetical protein
MQTIQAFLIVVLSGFVWLTFILGLALAEEVAIHDRDWRVKGHIEDGKIYDREGGASSYFIFFDPDNVFAIIKLPSVRH